MRHNTWAAVSLTAGFTRVDEYPCDAVAWPL